MIFSPLLLFISIPLTFFAALTTTLALSTLCIRALIVYVELAAVLIQDQFSPRCSSGRESDPLKTKNLVGEASPARRRSLRRNSTASGSSNAGSITPRAPDTSGLGIYGSEGPTRDFEGVGGWRVPGPDDEDVLWTNMNSRLELPTVADGRQRHHHRARTSSSLTAWPLPPTPPTSWRVRTPTGGHHGRSTSPQEYFRTQQPSKSTTSLDTANTGKAVLRHKPSNSSVLSHSSARTSHISTSNG
ncbi:MAG: hypothetical protein Q9163_004053 [Psora crenata]